MAWETPKFSKSAVDKAGDAFRTKSETGSDYEIVLNWRAAHNFPLASIQSVLSRRAKTIDADCIVAKRIKRLFSITEKLKDKKTMRLSAMQDIGGCRAVVGDLSRMKKLHEIYKQSDSKHILVEENDYIKKPKPSGYRGVHLVYKYAGRRKEYHNHKIEIQLRSASQHAWATAVETVDLFTKQALKASKGDQEWLRFFALMGNAIAHMENCKPVPNTPNDKIQLRKSLLDYLARLDVFIQLNAFGKALQELPNRLTPDDHYFLLVIDPHTTELEIRGYSSYEFHRASAEYSEIESSIGNTDKNAVLVSVETATDLRRAYPNYFLDTSNFLDLVGRAVS